MPEVESFVGSEELPNFLVGCNVLVVLLPDTSETRNLVGEKVLYGLPRGAALIAAGRGGQVDEIGLIKALDEGHLAHAYLDVFDREPLPLESALWTHPDITLTPHIAGAPHATAVARLVIENLERVERGDAPWNVADETLGY
jgi:glyoxylate/hydroxypyruvate reductase A